jgi:hypothetical protein
VNGEYVMGIFAVKDVKGGGEFTLDYQVRKREKERERERGREPCV